MVRRKEAEISSLVYVVIAIVLLLLRIPNESVGLVEHCPWYCHFTYQFFHAGWLHLIVNCWALLCLVFYYEADMKMLGAAFIISASVPSVLFPLPEGVVTIGVSGVVFALMGMISMRVQRKFYYHGWVLAFILIGFFFRSCNAWLHLYCYTIGVLLSIIEYRRNKC